jgi:hypothetical protein
MWGTMLLSALFIMIKIGLLEMAMAESVLKNLGILRILCMEDRIVLMPNQDDFLFFQMRAILALFLFTLLLLF